MGKDSFHIKIEGDLSLKRLLADLPKKFTDNAIKAMARAAAAPIVTEARRRVPRKSGALKRAIGTSSIKKQPAVKVSVRRQYVNTAQGTKVPIQYAKQLALGNKVRKKRGKTRHPIGDFIKDAARAAGAESKNRLIQKSKKIISTQIAKYKASAKR